MAHLSRIIVYPIKSLDGVSVRSARMLPSGALADDRRFAIHDGRGNYVNGKRNPRVHLLRSSFDAASGRLRIAAGTGSALREFNVETERGGLENWLSEFFGFAVTFRENIGAGFPDDTDSPGPTIIAASTLREIANWFGLTLDQTRARFRTNLEVDGVPPFWEDRLYGLRGTAMRFSVGDVVLDGINPCQRCVVPARDAVTGLSVPEFAKRFVEMRRKFLPEWAESSRFNHYYRVAINTKLVEHKPGLTLEVGDPIKIIGAVGEPIIAASGNGHAGAWSGRLRVAKVIETTPTVRTFRLSSAENCKLPFTYLPGQHLNLELAIDGVRHRRCYTIASAPTRNDYCELTVKREEAGTVSRYLHENLREGMELDVSGPGGRFTFTGKEADGIALIGAGVGITPLMSVIRYLTHQKWPGAIDLIYCARTERDVIFDQELKSLTGAHPNLRVTTTLTQERGTHWAGLRGRITGDLLSRTMPDLARRRVHVCGPIEMANDVTRMLRKAGVPREQIRSEAFGGAMPTPAVVDETSPVVGSVTFSESGKSETVRLGQTIMDAATCAGIGIDRGCLAGICGRCKVKMLSGNVQMDVDEGLSEADKKIGYVLSCQAKPMGNVAVEV